MAKLIVSGYLGQDAVEGEVVSGDKTLFATKFSVAESEYKGKDDEGNPKYETTWYNCTIWNNESQASRLVMLKKGNFVSLIGRLSARMYEDKESATRMSLDVRVDRFSDISICRKDKGDDDEI